MEYAYRNRKPLFYLERFDEERSRWLKQQERELAGQHHAFSLRLRARGRLDDALVTEYWGVISATARHFDERDEQMAWTLAHPEQLWVKYPHLSQSPKVRGFIGGVHRPERYLPGINVIDAGTPSARFYEWIKEYQNGLAFGTFKQRLYSLESTISSSTS
jgi:hypothetical protein